MSDLRARCEAMLGRLSADEQRALVRILKRLLD